MTKALSFICSALLAVAMTAVPVFAEEPDKPTMCLDNDSSVSLFNSTYDNEKVNKLSVMLYDKDAVDGYCYLVSANKPEATENLVTGIGFSTEALNIQDFEECNISFSYKLTDEYLKHSDKFIAYSDGVIWFEQEITAPEENSNNGWHTASIDIPKSAKNTLFGIALKNDDIYSGTMMLIDNITVTDADGNVVPNVGDYSAVEVKKTYEPLKLDSLFIRIVRIVVIALLVILMIYIVLKILKKRKEEFR